MQFMAWSTRLPQLYPREFRKDSADEMLTVFATKQIFTSRIARRHQEGVKVNPISPYAWVRLTFSPPRIYLQSKDCGTPRSHPSRGDALTKWHFEPFAMLRVNSARNLDREMDQISRREMPSSK